MEEDEYTISHLRHLISRASTCIPTAPQFQLLQPPQQQSDPHHHHHNHNHSHYHNEYEMLMMGQQQQQQQQQLTPTNFNNNNNNNNCCGIEVGLGRWQRPETLILLQVRSKLHHQFTQANHKAPLWDQVARIMWEEHGYQRSGKKCREKFENLYKYYKKTKEGKARRQDGRHYRFFRQLEALYGDHSQIVQNTPHFNQTPISPQPSTASLSKSRDFDTSSSDSDDVINGSMDINNKLKKKRRWKVKIKDFIDQQMKRIMEKQEVWLDKVMETLEEREKERMNREELWRRQVLDARIEKGHKFWAKERAWIEARDLAQMEALEKLTSSGAQWAEPELARLIQTRTSMGSRFEQCGFSQEVLWEDIAAKMAYFGYERSAIVCEEKWGSISKTLQEKGNHKRKNKGKSSSTKYGGISSLNEGGLLYIHNNNQTNGININTNGNNYNNFEPRLQLNDGSSPSPSHNSNINNVNSTNVMNDSCLRFFLGDGDNNLGWESNYGLKGQQG